MGIGLVVDIRLVATSFVSDRAMEREILIMLWMGNFDSADSSTKFYIFFQFSNKLRPNFEVCPIFTNKTALLPWLCECEEQRCSGKISKCVGKHARYFCDNVSCRITSQFLAQSVISL